MAKYIEVPENFIIERQIMNGPDTVGVRRIDLSFLPAADVAPVVHGKWVVGGVYGNGVIGNWKCDICKGVSLKKTLYCPCCGAKMDLEE